MRRNLTLSILLVLATAGQVFAVGEARIVGKVVDQNGKPVPAADILVTSEARNFKQSYKSDKNGSYSIMLLNAVSPYKMVVTGPGLGPVVREGKLKLLPEVNDWSFTLAPPTATTAAPGTQAVDDPGAIAYNEGVELYNGGKHAEAIAKFEEAVKLNPKLGAAYKTLAISFAREEKWAKVVEYGEQAVVYYGDEDEALAEVLAIAYEKTGDKSKASQFRQKAPANATALFNEAADLINSGKDAEAEPLLLKSIEADPKFVTSYYELGMVYARLGKNSDARTYLQKYLEMDPKGKDAATAAEMLKYVK